MKITATALDSFAHGCKKYTTGDLVEAMPGEIDDLIKAGLVSVDEAPAAEEAAAEENIDDLVGGEKMEDAPENKMAAAPANKKAR
jgi:hypothetical protein